MSKPTSQDHDMYFTGTDSKLWECAGCKQPFPARSLYPVQGITDDLKSQRFLLCRDCLNDYEHQDCEYEDQTIEIDCVELRQLFNLA
jgi:hypothetical protein